MNPKQKIVLSIIGFLSVALLFVGAGFVDNGRIGLDDFLWIQALAIFIGLFALVGAAEKILDAGLAEFKATALWWAALFAILGYFARISALDDVNKIFHIDASALPMTLVAASAMRFFLWMKWPFIIVAVGSIGILFLMWRGTYFPEKTTDGERLASGVLTLSNLVCCGLAAIFISYQLDDIGRQQKLYRTAHAADFVSKFSCSGVDDKKFSVLFIGPEQRKILVAPKLPSPSFFGTRSAEFLQALEVPPEFPVVDCVLPSVNLEQWLQNLSTSTSK
jgi:hypothetical protein